MAIVARYQRHISPPASPSPWRRSKNSDLTNFLPPSNAHLRAPLPRTDSENRREDLAKQVARDDEPVSLSASVGGEDASYSLAKAVVGRYVESYFPGIKEQQVVLERGVEVVGEGLRQRHRGNSSGRKGRETTLSSLVHCVEVEWMVWSRITPPAVALYSWWVVFAIWKKLDDGERGFLVQFTTHRDRVETWLTWAFVGLVALLCVLALVVWAAVEAIRLFSGSKFGRPQGKGDKSTCGS